MNSFEQLQINYANERLHALFVDAIFRAEQEEYLVEVGPLSCVMLVSGRVLASQRLITRIRGLSLACWRVQAGCCGRSRTAASKRLRIECKRQSRMVPLCRRCRLGAPARAAAADAVRRPCGQASSRL